MGGGTTLFEVNKETRKENLTLLQPTGEIKNYKDVKTNAMDARCETYFVGSYKINSTLLANL